MSLSEPIMSVLCEFESAFSPPTWSKIQVLIIGTLLARGRRTVTAALRQMGLREASHFSLYHHVLNRARWSALALSRRILLLLVRTFVAMGGPLTFVIDETWERRWGGCMSQRGHDRDPLASSPQRSGATSGLRWIVLTLVITPPWTPRPWALPVWSVPAPTPAVSRRLGLRQKTVPQRARQLLLVGRRWRPGVELTVIGDHTYSVHERGGACARRGSRLVAPLRLDAALYEPGPPRMPGTHGRPRVKGERVPPLKPVLTEAQTPWQRIRVRWYHGRRREWAVTSGTGVWDRSGQPVLPSRWVLVREPTGRLAPRAYRSTCTHDRPRTVVQQFVQRWSIEATFAESRAHLGLETQRP
jgi:DDE superfamily endonuclease